MERLRVAVLAPVAQAQLRARGALGVPDHARRAPRGPRGARMRQAGRVQRLRELAPPAASVLLVPPHVGRHAWRVVS
jgi:hypothetical protein